jgi:hypothetical protein
MKAAGEVLAAKQKPSPACATPGRSVCAHGAVAAILSQTASELENRTMSFATWIRSLQLVPARSRTSHKHRSIRRPTGKPTLELLEDRLAPATLTVNTTADNTTDTSVLTLRDAITLVNHAGDPASLGQPSMPTGWAAQIDTTSPFGSNDTIDFAIPTTDSGYNYDSPGAFTIQPRSALPSIINPVLLNGYSQTGASLNKLLGPCALGSTDSTLNPQNYGDNAVLKIELDGANAGTSPGLVLNASNITVQGLVINRFAAVGVVLDGVGSDLIQGNFLGTDVSGTVALPNTSDGVDIIDGASNNTIGGVTAAARNIISGNVGNGVYIQGGSGNVVQGNFIGTDVTGMASRGNTASGVSISGGSNNSVGGTDTNTPGAPLTSAGNLISGNATVGVAITGSGNFVQGNYIGTNATGTHAVPNQHGIGLFFGATSNYIGTTGLTDYGDGNLVSGNRLDGIYIIGFYGVSDQNVVAGNYIGTDATGTQPLGNGAAGVGIGWTAQTNQIGGLGLLSTTLPNTIAFNGLSGVWIISDGTYGDNTTGNSIRDNSIHDNSGLGIDLGGDYDPVANAPVPGPDGVTLNDSEGHSAPNNPNNFQDFPVLASAVSSGSSTVVAGTFSEAAEKNTTLTLDFYANAAPDPSGYGQGQTYLGSTQVTTDGSGNASISVNLQTGNLANEWLTATATAPDGSTSEFSANLPILAPNETFATFLGTVLPQSSPTANSLTIPVSATATPASVIGAVNGLTNVVYPVTVILDLGGGTYSTGGITANPPPNVTFVVRNGTLDPSYPALTVAGGHVSVLHCTLTTSGDTPTILVTGGSLTLLNDVVIQSSTSSTDPAISVTGGTVNLGTAATPGNNTLRVNNSGDLVSNTSGNAISAVGDTFVVGGTVETAPSLSFTTAVSSAATSLLNQAVTFTATVQSNGAGTPTGSVDFFDATTNADLGSVVLSSGTALLTTKALAAGSHVIQVRYGGDGTFLPSLAVVVQSVQYNFSGFLPPLHPNMAYAQGRTIPIKFQLSDANGQFITSLSAITNLQVAPVNANGSLGTPFNPTAAGGTGLRYDATANQYVFNWQTRGLAAGAYQILLALNDGTTHTLTLTLSSSGAFQLADGTTSAYISATANQVLYGDLTVAMQDDTGAGIDSSELNRLNDALSYLNAALGSFGVNLSWADPGTTADVHVHFASSTPQGGASAGVLGFTTVDNDVYLVTTGWNFYTGSDPTQVGANQYDFLTLATHELAHTVGLGESSDPASVMYEYLALGTARRTFTDGNLSAINTDADRFMKVEADAPGRPAAALPGRLPPASNVLDATAGSLAVAVPLAPGPMLVTSAGQTLPAPHGVLLGSSGNDVLVGGAGNDLILGGQARDFLVGGFVHEAPLTTPQDVLRSDPASQERTVTVDERDSHDLALDAWSLHGSVMDDKGADGHTAEPASDWLFLHEQGTGLLDLAFQGGAGFGDMG